MAAFTCGSSDIGMAVHIDNRLTPAALLPAVNRLFALSAGKIVGLDRRWPAGRGTPVFTVKGRYACRGWTEWTRGFQIGSALLQYEATGDGVFLELGRRQTIARMPAHVSHMGVHDHGFNIGSTYGNLWRLAREGRWDASPGERGVCELALRVSGAVQAARWTRIAGGGGFIYSFNGPHSLFVDTLRSLRSLAVAHQLGHVLMGERDAAISLLGRLLDHARATATYAVYYGTGRDAYDVRGRVAHESIFNGNDGQYRCPNSQQGYSPFSTWTRGLAWAILGFAEQLEFLGSLPAVEIERALEASGRAGGRASTRGCRSGAEATAGGVMERLRRAALATADYYLEVACADGIPVWDTGAPGLHRLEEFASRPADPYNRWEPVDSSAAAIAAQGLWRLGVCEAGRGERARARRYRQAALTVARTLFAEPYLSVDARHEGLVLHSVYHRPNGWDYVAPGQKVPNGESSMWGDYHARELAVVLARAVRGEPRHVFFDERP